MSPITYSEAATMLGVNEAALRSAVGRGIFTRLPRTGARQTLIREQVELFQGKGRLSLHGLSVSEKETWARYAQAGARLSAQSEKQPAQAGPNGADLAALGLLAGAGTLALMPVVLPGTGAPGMGVPQGDPFPVRLISLKITL